MAFRPNKKGQYKWTYIGICDITVEDEIVPDFRELSNMANAEEYHRNYGYAIQRFYPHYERFYIQDLSLIQHLSYWQHFHPIRFNYLLTTYWTIANGDSVENVFMSDDKNYHMVRDSKGLLASMQTFKNLEKVKRLRAIE